MGFSKGNLLAINPGKNAHGILDDSHVIWRSSRNVSLKPA